MELKLNGKVVLVTTGGTGIGAAVARRLSDSGAKVVITGCTASSIKSLADEIGGLSITGDVGNESHCIEAVSAAVHAFGGLDILVANAGAEAFGSATKIGIPKFYDTKRTNVDGVILAARTAIEPMRLRGGAS